MLNVVLFYALLYAIFKVAKANEEVIMNVGKHFKLFSNFIGNMPLEIYLT